jgi:HEPN domain-containing protein
MNASEGVQRVLREWVQKAEDDLKVAAHVMKLGANCPPEAVCFHAQQCVEKYLKAILVWHQKEFPKTHDIGDLVSLMPFGVTVDIPAADQRRLTGYGVVVRYPSEGPPILLPEARRALAIARRIRTQTRKLLPKAPLRRKKTES